MSEPSKEAKRIVTVAFAGDRKLDDAMKGCALAFDALREKDRHAQEWLITDLDNAIKAERTKSARLVEALVAARHHIQGSSPLAALSSIADALVAQERTPEGENDE